MDCAVERQQSVGTSARQSFQSASLAGRGGSGRITPRVANSRLSHPFAAVLKSALWKFIRPIGERLKAIAARVSRARITALDRYVYLEKPQSAAASPAAQP